MHPSAAENLTKFVNKYLVPLKEIDAKLTIIDIGSQDINGNNRTQFNSPNWKYIGVDIVEGNNVDIVLKDPYKYPFENNSVDIVVSTNTFEHIEFPWKSMEEIARVIKPGGLICIIAPSFGGKHEETDCWRILIDGMKSLCKWSKLEPIEVYIDQANSWWLDCVLIATKIIKKKKGK